MAMSVIMLVNVLQMPVMLVNVLQMLVINASEYIAMPVIHANEYTAKSSGQ